MKNAKVKEPAPKLQFSNLTREQALKMIEGQPQTDVAETIIGLYALLARAHECSRLVAEDASRGQAERLPLIESMSSGMTKEISNYIDKRVVPDISK